MKRQHARDMVDMPHGWGQVGRHVVEQPVDGGVIGLKVTPVNWLVVHHAVAQAQHLLEVLITATGRPRVGAVASMIPVGCSNYTVDLRLLTFCRTRR
jgi:hypothetical protein